jgi:hypothetical protein
MKTEHPSPNDAALDQRLQAWRVEARLPSSFPEAVWQRIERAEARLPGWLRFVRRASLAMERPALAVSCASALALAGLAAGYWQAHAANARADEHLGARYVQMIAAYQRTATPGP